jgi:CRP/FNR family cyclic AMP-dependent transcriptional regulator
MEWDRDAVLEALRRWPDVSFSLLAGMARRQRDLQRRVAGLCRQRAPRRLARALAALLEERGVWRRDGEGRSFMLLPRTPSRVRLGETAGMARETVSRLLAEWARRGWIGTQGGDLTVLDRGQWRRLAGETWDGTNP